MPAQVTAEGSRRVEAALLEQQRIVTATAARLRTAGGEDIHRGRVAARRMRSLLKTFLPMLEVRRTRLMRADLRSYARRLAAVREADVRRDLLLGLAQRDAHVGPAYLRPLRAKLDEACVESRETLRRHVAEPGWSALCRALEDRAALDRLLVRRDVDIEELLRLVEDSWRKAVRLLERKPEGAAELHELRLALKHCRYALEPVADIESKCVARLLRRLRSAQDSIGEHRDTLLADHWLRLNERSLGREVVGRLGRLLDRHEKAMRSKAASRASRVLPAYVGWRDATRSVRKGRKTRPA